MSEEGRYIYCVVPGTPAGEFRSPAVGNNGGRVFALPYQEIAAVVSESSADPIKATPDNCFRHERVLEEVLTSHPALVPFEFATVAPSEKAVTTMLRKNYSPIQKALRKITGRVEINVKANWHDMQAIFQEVVAEHAMIAHFKAEIAKRPVNATYQERIRIGQMVSGALQEKKLKESTKLLQALKRHAKEVLRGATFGDAMIMNASFLVPQEEKAAFEQTLYALGHQHEGRVDFAYEDGRPPYSFVNVHLRVSP